MMKNCLNKLYLKGLTRIKEIGRALKDERGDTNIIAIIIILAIVIALAIVFKKQLKDLFDKIWTSLFANVDNTLA